MYITVPDEKINLIKSIIPRLEEISNTKIELNERTKSINVTPLNNNAYDAMKVISIIKAIGVGFDPEDAMKLMKDDYILEIIDLKDVSNGPDDLKRIKGRIIGEKGKTKKIIQEYTGVNIIITDHYVGILGNVEQADIAKRAIEMLIKGREHSTVYKYLDRAERDLYLFKINRALKEGLNNT
ncbi:KH domain-containing protein [Sulfurisphaera javensis]|uniref:KH domain-containing protein n=1 Tax=Sulfurisphaera javensis TaxID=2049879 RepID=A0AAT9GRU8_9CREN